MKKIIVILAGIVLIAAFAVAIPYFSFSGTELTSPVLNESKTLGLNQWFPNDVLGTATPGVTAYSTPEVTAKAAFFIEISTGEVLYSKNVHEKLPIASLVKVMTAVVALEHRSLDEKLLVSQRATEMEPDEMILLPGEKLTMKELLYGIFLVSANDAAEVLAESTAGSRDDFTSQSEGSEDRRSRFIKLMNDKAKQIGMKNTRFVNSTGLDEDSENSYSTAYDMVILSRYAIKHFPVLVEISKTEHIYIERTAEHQDYDMYSGINLLTTYPGVVGFKTGYTPEAGLTLITLVRKNGHEVLGVLLGSENRREEARELLDFSFEKLNY